VGDGVDSGSVVHHEAIGIAVSIEVDGRDGVLDQGVGDLRDQGAVAPRVGEGITPGSDKHVGHAVGIGIRRRDRLDTDGIVGDGPEARAVCPGEGMEGRLASGRAGPGRNIGGTVGVEVADDRGVIDRIAEVDGPEEPVDRARVLDGLERRRVVIRPRPGPLARLAGESLGLWRRRCGERHGLGGLWQRRAGPPARDDRGPDDGDEHPRTPVAPAPGGSVVVDVRLHVVPSRDRYFGNGRDTSAPSEPR